MKKIILIIAMVAFVGMIAAPVNAAPVRAAVEEVKDKKDEKKDEKTTDTAKCEAKSDCCAKTKACDEKEEVKKEKK